MSPVSVALVKEVSAAVSFGAEAEDVAAGASAAMTEVLIAIISAEARNLFIKSPFVDLTHGLGDGKGAQGGSASKLTIIYPQLFLVIPS
ncbi:hypothetical protein [Pseudomonas veronii]